MSSDPQRPDRPIFALDENFPEPLLLDIVRIRTPELDLRHVRTIDARLRGLLDHRLILALFQSGVEGLVTNDDRMIFLPEVLAEVSCFAPRTFGEADSRPTVLAARHGCRSFAR